MLLPPEPLGRLPVEDDSLGVEEIFIFVPVFLAQCWNIIEAQEMFVE